MDKTMWIAIIIPFLGTVLGSSMVFFLKGEIKARTKKTLLGFAAGVMVAASVWSLMIPSIQMAEETGAIIWLPASIGFLLGIGILLLIDSLLPHLHLNETNPEGIKTSLKKTTMLVLAITLHNFPEGMAVGVALVGGMTGHAGLTVAGAIGLAIGIAIQNFPEGAIVSMPLRGEGLSKKRCFLYGSLSGLVEPLGAIITILLTNHMTAILPYFLSFAAGAMMYVVVEELIPEAQEGKHTNISTVGFAIGFIVMMILDTTLG